MTSEWISVEERLPSLCIRVLAYGRDGWVGESHRNTLPGSNRIFGVPETGWFNPCGKTLDKKSITHWMPLPPPPQEDRDEG